MPISGYMPTVTQVLLPLIVSMIPFVRRFLLASPGLWFFDANISISTIILIYTLANSITKEDRGFSLKDRILLPPLLAQVPLGLLTFLGGPIEDVQWAITLRNFIRDDGGLQALIGLFQGLCGIYVYILGGRLGSPYLQLTSNLREPVSMISLLSMIFSMIIAIIIFAAQAPYMVFWPLRSVLLISGFMLGVLSLATGVSLGGTKNAFLFFLGATFDFSLCFIIGTMLIPLTRIQESIFPAMAAFVINTLLLTGVIGYLIGNERSFLCNFIRSFINKITH